MSATLSCQKCGTQFESLRSDAKWCQPCKIDKRKEIYQRYEVNKRELCPDCRKQKARRSMY